MSFCPVIDFFGLKKKHLAQKSGPNSLSLFRKLKKKNMSTLADFLSLCMVSEADFEAMPVFDRYSFVDTVMGRS